MKISIDMKLPSLANCRMHWRALAKIKSQQRLFVALSMRGHKLPPLPAVVTFTRTGPRKLDDDNLSHAFKAVRDEVAAKYGVDDGSDLYTWRYEQRTEKKATIEIEIESVTNGRKISR